jgi:hypothetical protein
MILTGNELIEYFKSCCKKYHKLFIPDSPRQEQVADALATFYRKDGLEEAIEYFVKSRPGPFLVFDFAIESRSFVERIEFEKKSQDKFKDIVQETKKRLGS